MNYRNHRISRKLFIPIGIISLAVISFWGFKEIAEITNKKSAPQHCIDMFFCTQDTSGYNPVIPSKISKSRKYKLFKLTGDTISNKPVLEEARKYLNKIKYDRDTINGVHILLTDSTCYKDFVKALDNCGEKFPGAFAPFENNIWAYYLKIDTIDVPKEVLAKWRKKYGRL
jgi:hypothetical protein